MTYLLPGPGERVDKLQDFIDQLLNHPKFKKLIIDSVSDKVKINLPKKEKVPTQGFPAEFYKDPIGYIFENVTSAERKIMIREINRRYGE